MTSQVCPVCSNEVEPSVRYPRYLCNTCARQATGPDGRQVEFFDEPVFRGRFVDADEDYHSTIVSVQGVRCRATPAHFGGIVVVPVPTSEPEGDFSPTHCSTCGAIVGGFCRGAPDSRRLDPCPKCGSAQPRLVEWHMWPTVAAVLLGLVGLSLLGALIWFAINALTA